MLFNERIKEIISMLIIGICINGVYDLLVWTIQHVRIVIV